MAPSTTRWNPLTWFKAKPASLARVRADRERSSLSGPIDLRLESRPTPLFPMLLGGSVAALVITAIGAAWAVGKLPRGIGKAISRTVIVTTHIKKNRFRALA